MPVDGTPIHDPTDDGPTLDVATQIFDSKRWQYVLQALWKAGAPVAVSDTDPQPVSAASLPLPSGAATEASLAAVLAKLPTLVGGLAPVVLPAGELHLGEVGGRKVSVTDTFSRPTDTNSYIAGDAVRNATSSAVVMTFANFARVNGGSGYIVGARLTTDKKSITPRFRVHLFNDSSATLSQDNEPYRSLYADESKRIGSFDLPAMSTGADATNSTESRAADMGLRVPFVAAAGTRSIFAVLEALDAFAPANAEAFSLTLLADLD